MVHDPAHNTARAAVAPLARHRAAALAPLFERFSGRSNLPTLQNRIIFPPCTRWLTPGGAPGAAADSMAEYYARRARHVGLVVTEGVYLDLKGGTPYPDASVFYGAEALAQWRDVVDAVHREGGLIVPQIHHVGIQNPGPTLSPSGLTLKGKAVQPAATLAEIEGIKEAFVEAARNAARLGFDGVAIHSAHGYLLHEFLWDFTNRRDDAYGGDAARRRRLLVEIVEGCRAATDAMGLQRPVT